MKRSEAIENARQVAGTNPYEYTCFALHGVITDLLEHIDSTIPAPDCDPDPNFAWPPSSHYTPVSAPDYDPDDVAFSEECKAELASGEPSGNSGQLHRLVEVEQESPTLDQMPEGIRHEIADKYGDASDTFVGFRVGDDAYRAADSQGELPAAMKCGGPARQFAVLDAEPKQQTVNDLRPGDVFEWDGSLWLLITRRWGGCSCACVPIDPGEEDRGNTIKFPDHDTPIGQVYRFEVQQDVK